MRSFKEALTDLHDAPIVSPRGRPTKELIAMSYEVPVGMERYQHKARKLNSQYVDKELEWYKRGMRYDLSILPYAKMWETCIAADGGINSNYGQYLMGEGYQLERVINELKHDPESRRAVAMILGQMDIHWTTPGDMPCTTHLQFLLRNSHLICIANMRSQDAVWGAGNDIPAFAMFRDMVAEGLNVTPGVLIVQAASFHILSLIHI
jgi:thymidylate synthase